MLEFLCESGLWIYGKWDIWLVKWKMQTILLFCLLKRNTNWCHRFQCESRFRCLDFCTSQNLGYTKKKCYYWKNATFFYIYWIEHTNWMSKFQCGSRLKCEPSLRCLVCWTNQELRYTKRNMICAILFWTEPAFFFL